MKTILVTGGSGFIGSNFIIQQIEIGNFIVNIDNLTYAADLSNLKDVDRHKNYLSYKGDIADPILVSKILPKHKIDCIVNFAAESHVDNSIDSPGEFIHTNVVGTFNLLQCSLKYFGELSEEKKKDFRFLHVSTDEVFGDLKTNDPKFNENTPYNPSSPYSASKAASDHLVNSWARTYGLPVVITNCSNNFGPRQNKEKLIPKTIYNCLNGIKIPVYGKGENIRDWIYVDDHCQGVNLALTKGRLGEKYCLGGNSERTNIDIVTSICEYLDSVKPSTAGSYKNLIDFVEDRKGHDFRYAIDDAKARNELGFIQTKSFDERLKETIDWYLDKFKK